MVGSGWWAVYETITAELESPAADLEFSMDIDILDFVAEANLCMS